MAIVIIDDQEVSIGDRERLNGIEAARLAGVEIPHYCWHAGLSVVASCRMCLVETGRKDPQTGAISMMPKLSPACQTPATDGTVFVTNSDKVREARAMVEEDLLLRHPVDCPICDKAGECLLQDYHFQHGRDQRRADIKPFHSRRRSLGDTVTLFVDRCVMCSRCVRFCREVSGTNELMITDRGAHEEIDVFPGYPLDNKLSGNVVDLCPVGALGDKDFLYQQRVWFLSSQPSVCGGCSTGCSIHVEHNQDRIYRLKPRYNRHVNQWWICDDGRYGWKYVHDSSRLVSAVRRATVGAALLSGEQPASAPPARGDIIDGQELAPLLDALLGTEITLVLSPWLTVEEAYLAVSCARQRDPQARLAMGPIPTQGQDEVFPQGFTIRAEKCPNRRGVEMVLDHAGQWLEWEELLQANQLQPRGALWIFGGYPEQWHDASAVETIPPRQTLILHDLFSSPLSERADVIAPEASFAERDGSFVNANDRLQSFGWAIRPPAGVVPAGRLLWSMNGRRGLYDAAEALQEAASTIVLLSNARAPISDAGVDLRGNQLA